MKSDQCVMVKKTEHGEMCIVLYLDYLLIIYSNKNESGWFIVELEWEYESIAVEKGNEFTYLGMVVRKHLDGIIELHMKGYLNELFKFYLDKRDIKESEKPVGASLFDINEYKWCSVRS